MSRQQNRNMQKNNVPGRKQRDQAPAVEQLESFSHALVAADNQSRVVRPQKLVRDILPKLHPCPSSRHLTALDWPRVRPEHRFEYLCIGPGLGSDFG